jgi:uncharacterized protein YhfF
MGPTNPTAAALKTFVDGCHAALPGVRADSYRTRCIGWNRETSESICKHILAREKTGTFSAPWLWAAHPNLKPEIAQFVVFHTFDGTPRALLQTKQLTLLTFKEIDETHTALDGPSVRALDTWRGIHIKYWNSLLGPLGKEVVGEMPVVVERFECLHPKH